MDNKKDIQAIDTAEEQYEMGVAIAKGILLTLGIEYKPPAPQKWYKVQVGAFKNRAGAEKLLADLKAKGYDGFIVVA